MLTDELIRLQAATSSAYTKGCQYYRDRHVRKLRLLSDYTFEARVLGRELYTAYINFNDDQEVQQYKCDCPAFYSDNGACKHIIAALKTLQRDWSLYFGLEKQLPLTRATEEMLTFFQRNAIASLEPAASQQVTLRPIYGFSVTPYQKISWLEFMIGTERMYVVRDIPQLLAALDSSQELIYGKSFTLRPQEASFDPFSQSLLAILQHAYQEEKQRSSWGYQYGAATSAFAEARRFRLTNTNLLRFFDAVGKQPFAAQFNNTSFPAIRIQDGRPSLTMAIQAIDGGLLVSADLAGSAIYGLDADFSYLFHEQKLYRVDSLFASHMKPLINCFQEVKKPEIRIPSAAVSDFVTTVLPALESLIPVQVDAAVQEQFYHEPLEKLIYFDRFGDGMSARIEFRYGDIVINPLAAPVLQQPDANGKWVVRSTLEESRLLSLFKRYGFTDAAGKLVQSDEDAIYTFLQQALPELRSTAEIFYADDFKHMKLSSTGKITAGIRLNADSNMLEFSLHHEGTSPKELLALLASYKLKKRYHRLQDGSFISLDAPDFQTAAKLIDQLGLRSSDLEKQTVELPKYRALYLDSLARESEGFQIERNRSFKKMVQDIREPQDIEYSLPHGIQGKLRDYQKTGFKWLKSLASYGLGGILADDMGLGKTLQVLTFLLSEKEIAPGPSIVIAPTSLVYNWQDEVTKFAPALKIIVVAGQQSNRVEQLQGLEQADLIVTSYGLIKRDISLYEQKNFKYCFLDEAQHVKNPNTLNAKAVKRIKALSYFALTGTPIENTLTELWSIFDFVMPGYLRSHKAFTSRFEIPIVKNDDNIARQELARHIRPFILRRMKKTVLKELPEKIESKMVSEMTDEQAKLYEAWLLQARSELEAELSTSGFEKSQIKILSLLTRLRQICCHPSLFIENYQGGSGKLEALQEIIKDAISGGHRILLFSQFTGMLHLIRQVLTELDISFHYLDGATKAEERIRLVHAFNAGDKNVFLISLKAGGTGLNLTGADMVIHYDPWWNPAVEEQATDRAYRIGQNNSVQVYKLITKDTIEEKIYLLQQKKKELIDTLIEPGENLVTKLTEAEIRELFM